MSRHTYVLFDEKDTIQKPEAPEKKEQSNKNLGKWSRSRQNSRRRLRSFPSNKGTNEGNQTHKLLSSMTKNEIQDLEKKFEKFPGTKMPEESFISLLSESLHESKFKKRELHSMLRELFNEIDYSGDGNVNWEEFSSFVMAASSINTHEDAIKKYRFQQSINVAGGEDSLRKIKYFDEWSKLVMCGKSRRCQILTVGEVSRPILTLPDHPSSIIDVEYINDPDQILVTTASDLCVRFWDASQTSASITMPLKHREKNESSQLSLCAKKRSGDYPLLLSGGRAGTVSIWDRESWSIEDYFQVHKHSVMDILDTKQGSLIYTAGMDGVVSSFDIERKTKISDFKGHSKGVLCLAYSPQHHFLFSTGFEHNCYVWSPNCKQMPPVKLYDNSAPHMHSLVGVQVIENTPQVITGDMSGFMKVWDIRTFHCVQSFHVSTSSDQQKTKSDSMPYSGNNMNSFTYIPILDSIVGAGGSTLYFHEYDQMIRPECAHDQPIDSALYNPTTVSILSVSGCHVKVWNAEDGSIISRWDNLTNDVITAACIDDRGRKFFVGTHKGEIFCYNFATGGFIDRIQPSHNSEVTSICYNRNMNALISTSWDGNVHISPDKGSDSSASARILDDHAIDVMCSTSSYMLSIFVTGDIEGNVFVFDSSTQTRIAKCTDQSEDICCLEFMEPYPAFIVSDGSTELNIWTTRPYMYPWSKLISFSNKTSRVNFNSAVTCMKFDGQRNILFTGDEAGYIGIWDMSDLVNEAHFANVSDSRISKQEMKEVKSMQKSKIEDDGCIRLIKTWKAHNESIRSLDMVQSCIMTGGLDSRIIIWSNDGRFLGSLRQSPFALDPNFEHDDCEYQNPLLEKGKGLSFANTSQAFVGLKQWQKSSRNNSVSQFKRRHNSMANLKRMASSSTFLTQNDVQ
eukprot:gb/GECH01007082.1/.p1 GENE.gb/GECH01007082.1/~~gb/GECH01007082.1/.p1  ORF type:complete len:908 (+),score=150.91 gb/GECH01007082.1/:1-2724(+)